MNKEKLRSAFFSHGFNASVCNLFLMCNDLNNPLAQPARNENEPRLLPVGLIFLGNALLLSSSGIDK